MNMDIVVDFDGTCVTCAFPKVGEDIGAAQVLKRLIKNGHNLILFTMRCDVTGVSIYNKTETPPGQYLTDAIEWFNSNEIALYGIQKNPSQLAWTTSPKAHGDLIIDDSALGCPLIFDDTVSPLPFIDWEAVELRLEYMGYFKTKDLNET